MPRLLKELNGRPTSRYKVSLSRQKILQFCAAQLIMKYPELSGLELAVNLDYNKESWEVSINGIYEEENFRPARNGEDNTSDKNR